VSYEEQIMSKDKYPNTFSPQMEAIVYYPSNLFRVARDFEYWGIFSDIPSCSWGIVAHVTCLDQSCMSENV